MSDAVLRTVACIVVGIQLLVPLAFGVPVLRSDVPDDDAPLPGEKKRKKHRNLLPKPRGGRAVVRRIVPPLKPLVCARCRAPVPLVSSSFPCPYCAAPVEPPREYTAALADRARAAKELARAERTWRWSRLTSSPWLLWPVRLVDVAWSLFVGLCALLLLDWVVPWPLLAVAGTVAFFQVFVGLMFISGFADMRKALPPLPKPSAFVCDAETAPCRGCGAPMQFPANHLAAVCNYCEADNYRASLALAARDKAAADKGAAGKSLLDAARDIRGRRTETLSFVAFLAITELFFAVVWAIAGVAMFVDSLLG